MIPTNTHMTSIPTLPRLLILVIALLIWERSEADTTDVLEETFTTFVVNQNETITDAVVYNPTTRAAQTEESVYGLKRKILNDYN